MSLYQIKAWEILGKKIEQMKKDGFPELAKELGTLMSESASEAFKMHTKAEDVAELLTDAVNSSRFEAEEFANQITHRTHRTLQQSTMRAFMACVNNWAEMDENGMYDLRNQSTVKSATKIKEALKDEYFPLV